MSNTDARKVYCVASGQTSDDGMHALYEHRDEFAPFGDCFVLYTAPPVVEAVAVPDAGHVAGIITKHSLSNGGWSAISLAEEICTVFAAASAPSASAEPVALAVISDNDLVRIWWRASESELAEEWAEKNNAELTALYQQPKKAVEYIDVDGEPVNAEMALRWRDKMDEYDLERQYWRQFSDEGLDKEAIIDELTRPDIDTIDEGIPYYADYLKGKIERGDFDKPGGEA